MEPNNTSRSPAAWASTSAVLEHGEPSVRDASLLSPAFSPAPPSGSESSWYQQIPPSPAVAAGNGSLSVVHAHATSSSESVPSSSSSFPTAAGKLPMVGYDLFGSPEATTAATPLPTFPGDQWQLQGESSSASAWAAAPVLPECPSPEGMFGFAAGEPVAWPCEDTSSSLFSPSSSAGGPAPQSSEDNLVGFAPPSSDSDELEALLQSFHIPSPAVKESPVVDAAMPPVEENEEEEEEMDVSAFLVSDPEDQLQPNASWTAPSPQMAATGSGGGASASWKAPSPQMAATSSGDGASASWMAPGNTGNNWPPPMLAPAAAASTCTMLSTSSSGSVACHSGGVASSIVGAMMKPPSSVPPPLVPPSSQGAAGASSSSNFHGFAPQPSSSSVLAPHALNLKGPLLPVKEEVMDVDDATPRRHPDFVSLDDDEDDGLYQDAIFGSSSTWPGSSSGSPSFAPARWVGGGGSPGFAPGNWGSGGSRPSFAPGSGGSGGGGGSSSPSFAPSRGGSGSPSFDWSMPSFDQSMSIDDYVASTKVRGRMASIRGLPLLPKSDVRASSTNGGTRIVFTDPEMAIIAKEKKLQELLRTDAKKVKRMLYNRAYSATAKVRKVMHTKNLERTIVELEERRTSLCAKLQSLQEGSAALKAQQMEMQMLIEELEQQTMLKDVVREGLKADIQNLKLQADIQNLKHLRLN